jgi:hypothetical protein
VDGVQMPFGWEVARPAGRFRIQLKDIQQNVAIDDSAFSLPSSAGSAAPSANLQ